MIKFGKIRAFFDWEWLPLQEVNLPNKITVYIQVFSYSESLLPLTLYKFQYKYVIQANTILSRQKSLLLQLTCNFFFLGCLSITVLSQSAWLQPACSLFYSCGVCEHLGNYGNSIPVAVEVEWDSLSAAWACIHALRSTCIFILCSSAFSMWIFPWRLILSFASFCISASCSLSLRLKVYKVYCTEQCMWSIFNNWISVWCS